MGSLPGAIPPFKVFIIGTSYAGVSSALNLLDLSSGRSPRLAHTPYEHHTDFKNIPLEITIADERDGYFHLIGTPLAFADAKYAAKSWVKFQDIPALQRPNVRFVQGTVDKVDPATKTATVLEHVTKQPQNFSYDFLIAASGLRRVFPTVPQSLTRKQFLLEAEQQINAMRNAPDGVVVVGGGAVGIEMAAELKLVEPNTKVTLVHSRDKLLSSEGLSDECKDKALELVKEAGVDVLLNHRLKETRKLDTPAEGGRARYEIEFANGDKLLASEVVMAISRSVPSTDYFPAAAKDDEGYVKVHPSLVLSSDIPNAADHLAIGDIALWSGIKRCGTAMHMGHFAAINAHQLMLARLTAGAHKPVFSELGPIEPMMGLAIGKKAVASGPGMGTTWGEDVMQAYFKNDLGFDNCWNHLGLSKAPEV
ncbi:Apoptosis-inducing factor-like protein A [Colletotrichum chlorophyti]|uniref:Apoptosis-inducing factor-like protein A n=1 Tax=Colletotrichum chlorophyti TaxID=708187 RepID=A0A1Q8S1P9_9PEZI|nr:Apoptosis-inducing factor-like protein A [Colletotrichum chlorophyti]